MVHNGRLMRQPDVREHRAVVVTVPPKGEAPRHHETIHDDLSQILAGAFCEAKVAQLFDPPTRWSACRHPARLGWPRDPLDQTIWGQTQSMPCSSP